MTRRAALWRLFAAGSLLGLVLLAIEDRMWDEGGPGIIGFELAWTADRTERILAEWGEDGRDAASLSLWLDFPYLAIYSAFWALAARAAGAGRRIWPLALAAGAFDFMENVFLHVVLGGAEGAAPLASVFATLKFAALAVVVGYVAVFVVRRFPRAAALASAVFVVALLALAWAVDRETRPAEPDVGRVLELPAGDIHVREDGPRDRPPLVLIHGYAASMRWWDEVVPLLAREHRVVRIDLLGHGGSEKPRDGYSMESQAEVVTQAMRALGVERAPVVGHSMGGVVGTAMVERFPRFVARLMMIGTPPDDENLSGGLLASAAFLPVVGQVNHQVVSDRVVRWTVEHGFAPEFDPPRRIVRDIFERTTWRSFSGSSEALGDYWDERALHERLAGGDVRVTVLLGEEERHAERSVRLYNSIPGARTVVMEGLDHSPQVEAPGRTAPLIAAFARER